jgi:Zn-dependent protease with chaperone function
MIVLGLLLFNGLLLFWLIEVMGQGMGWLPVTNSAWISATLSIFIVIGLGYLFHTSPGLWLLRFISGARRAITREQKHLDPIIAQVQKTIQEMLGKNPIDLQVMIVDDPMPNAAAMGKNTLILSRGLYETSNQNELAGVIAHELGHFHNGDSQRLATMLGVSYVSLLFGGFAGLIAAMAGAAMSAGKGGKDDATAAITVMLLPIALMAGIAWLFVKIFDSGFYFASLFTGRRAEYRADEFAVKAGYGAGLLAYLDKIKDMEFKGKKTLLGRLYATHPDTLLRIDRIDKALVGDLPLQTSQIDN